MLFFVVFSVLWNISSCAVIKTVEIRQLDDGTNWRENPLKRESNYLERFPSKPLDKDLTLERPSKVDRLSVKPFDQQYFTPTGFERRRSRNKRYIWDDEKRTTEDFFEWLKKLTFPGDDGNGFTVEPDSFYDYDRNSSYPGIAVFICIMVPVILVAAFLIIKNCGGSCNGTGTSSSYSPSPYQLHLPPRMAAPPPATNIEGASFNTAMPIPSQTLSTQSSGASNNLVDKPPDYSEVTLSDLVFPEVKPSASLETPPPRYEY